MATTTREGRAPGRTMVRLAMTRIIQAGEADTRSPARPPIQGDTAQARDGMSRLTRVPAGTAGPQSMSSTRPGAASRSRAAGSNPPSGRSRRKLTPGRRVRTSRPRGRPATPRAAPGRLVTGTGTRRGRGQRPHPVLLPLRRGVQCLAGVLVGVVLARVLAVIWAGVLGRVSTRLRGSMPLRRSMPLPHRLRLPRVTSATTSTTTLTPGVPAVRASAGRRPGGSLSPVRTPRRAASDQAGRARTAGQPIAARTGAGLRRSAPSGRTRTTTGLSTSERAAGPRLVPRPWPGQPRGRSLTSGTAARLWQVSGAGPLLRRRLPHHLLRRRGVTVAARSWPGRFQRPRPLRPGVSSTTTRSRCIRMWQPVLSLPVRSLPARSESIRSRPIGSRPIEPRSRGSRRPRPSHGSTHRSTRARFTRHPVSHRTARHPGEAVGPAGVPDAGKLRRGQARLCPMTPHRDFGSERAGSPRDRGPAVRIRTAARARVRARWPIRGRCGRDSGLRGRRRRRRSGGTGQDAAPRQIDAAEAACHPDAS